MARILLNTNSIPSLPSKSAVAEPPLPNSAESDFVVILAALLCALICAVGLIAVARCAWLRRGTTGSGGGRFGSQLAANRGLKKKVVQSLPKYVFGSSSSSPFYDESAGKSAAATTTTDCVICLTEYADGDEIRVLPQCGHRFHVQCIDTWLGSHSSCPSCRQILVVARCQKCGEFPTVSGVRPQLPPLVAVPFKGRPGYGLPSTSTTFLP